MSRATNILATRIVMVVVCLLAGGITASFLVYSPPAQTSTAWMTEPEVDLSVANSLLTPEKVVELQVASALESKQDPEALKVCYSFASPANRSFTGPYERFAQMVFSPPYHHLGDCVAWQVGTAHIEQQLAVVLVSVLAADGTTHAYRFYLSKQEGEPYKDCWMTDRVEPLVGVEFGSQPTAQGQREVSDESGRNSSRDAAPHNREPASE